MSLSARLALFAGLLATPIFAQISSPSKLIFVTADPAGACSNSQAIQYNPLTGNLIACNNSVWTNIGASGAASGATSVGLSMPSSLCAVTGSPVTSTGTLTCSYATGQTANRVIGTSSGGAVALMALTGAQLPNPSASTLGGVESLASVSHQWINTISTSGVPAATQPAFTDISGAVTAAQLPNPSASTLGGIESYAAVSNQWINAISTSGVPSSTQPAFTNISGSVAASQLPNPSASTLGGIESLAAVSHQWINTISTSGVPSATQPAFTDISGSVAASQMPALTGDVTTSAGAVATTIANNAVNSTKSAVVNTRRVCSIVIGADNGAAVLVNGDIAPQGRQCFVPYAATVVEVTVAGDAGTPNVVVAKNHAGSLSDLTSSALATASSGGLACSNTGGTTGLDAATTCSSTLQNTSIAAGDWIETHTATAGGTAKRMSISVTYTVN